jgi:hypothetical protein
MKKGDEQMKRATLTLATLALLLGIEREAMADPIPVANSLQSAIPEPSTLTLLGLGSLGLLAYGRRRRKQAA